MTATSVAAPAVLGCRDLTKHFGGVKALQGVSLQILEGQIIGLVGPNGSGKSTLINVLSGVDEPTSGQVSLLGERVDTIAAHHRVRRGLARTYQIPAPFASMTVLDNVAVSCMFGGGHTDRSSAREAAWEFLDETKLTAVADLHPQQINLHQRKFLELARALASQPTVLLLDEVMAGLTPSEVDASVAMVRRIAGRGVTLLIVEHLMRVITGLAERLVVLHQGSVLADGPTDDVLRQPDVIQAYLGRGRDA